MAVSQTPIAILIGPKGRGSNMLAILRACENPEFPAQVAVVVSPNSSSPAAREAESRGLLWVADPKSENYAGELLKAVDGCELICLAGYLRLLPTEVLDRFPNRVLNIHPALLPKFGGKGMYGIKVHEAVLEAGETESGCTVHTVTEHYDEGAPIVQLRCPVLPSDTPDTLAARVLELEHQAYPLAIREVLES